MSGAQAQYVYKIAARDAWEAACRRGAYGGSADDIRDGFIHLSAFHQVRATLAKHFRGQKDLVLIEFAAEVLSGALKWEPSRGGDLFPHLYAQLPTAAARAVHTLNLDETGAHVVPEDI